MEQWKDKKFEDKYAALGIPVRNIQSCLVCCRCTETKVAIV